MSSYCTPMKKKIWSFSCGTFVMVLALILGLLWPFVSVQFLHKELILKKGSLNYENWIKTPIPMYFEIYLFNWDNPESITDPNVKPKFTERGPYVFLETHERVDLEWNDNNTISFNQIRTWHFVREKSAGDLNDKITFLNPMKATVAYMMRYQNRIMQKIINYMLNNIGEGLNITKTVGEVLFDGYTDDLLTLLKAMNRSDVVVPFDKFGWFVERNGSKEYDGRFVMNTGEDSISNVGYLTMWNGANHTKYYADDCGTVRGTSGELWPPKLLAQKQKVVFATDVCRHMTLDPANETVEKFGIEGNKWIGTDRLFDNGEKYPEMACFCKADVCPYLKPGTVNVSECRFGAPVFVSFPHFYLADPDYIENVTGMQPKREKHEFSISLERTTGIPLEVNARIQINFLLQQYGGGYDIFKDVNDVMMPMFWFRQHAALTEELASKAKLAILLPDLGVYVAYGIGAIGLIIFAIALTLTILKKWDNPNDRQHLISKD